MGFCVFGRDFTSLQLFENLSFAFDGFGGRGRRGSRGFLDRADRGKSEGGEEAVEAGADSGIADSELLFDTTEGASAAEKGLEEVGLFGVESRVAGEFEVSSDVDSAVVVGEFGDVEFTAGDGVSRGDGVKFFAHSH